MHCTCPAIDVGEYYSVNRGFKCLLDWGLKPRPCRIEICFGVFVMRSSQWTPILASFFLKSDTFPSPEMAVCPCTVCPASSCRSSWQVHPLLLETSLYHWQFTIRRFPSAFLPWNFSYSYSRRNFVEYLRGCGRCCIYMPLSMHHKYLLFELGLGVGELGLWALHGTDLIVGQGVRVWTVWSWDPN